ncbi:MAG: biosynthetic arginine decarboxylase [Planctomycetota bacterium]|nr:biosynthetic arginine decarboxylase [Planctomycetota bacterium]
MPGWTHQDSETLYNVPNWSGGYFRINASGNVEVRPEGPFDPDGDGIDLANLIQAILRRGIEPPILLRFDGIVRSRVRELCEAFDQARAEYGYEAPYRCVFPIKVNQQRHMVDALFQEGKKHGMGIEVGSKPELLAVMALYSGTASMVICNGYKDREYIEMALLTSKLGTPTVLVIEKSGELDGILDAAEELGVRPLIGVRTKPGVSGAGRWRESGGDRSKFGLTAREIVHLTELLRERGMLDCLKLLHFHLGSQITEIRRLKNALGEATRTLVGLRELGAPIEWFDVGGGLGVDYDGSSTNFESSMNYTVQEYANDVVYEVKEACDDAGIPQPTIVSESGRALTAHHAVLVAEVLGVTDFSSGGSGDGVEEDEHEIVHEFAEVCAGVTAKNFQESYHDAVQIRDRGMTFFNVGQLDLKGRARVEEYFWRTCEKILRITRTLAYVPDDLANLERDMADTYFMNFSIFQSMPDSWAIQQLFPVLPIHRHGEEPSRRAVLADITCDSDGRIDRFIDLRDVKRTLELHPLHPDEPYYLGFFLVGAYQEILGDMHNLFGDTNVVHVDTNGNSQPRLTHVVPGDRVQDVLSYVEYFETDLVASLRQVIEKAIDADRLSFEDSASILRRFRAGLAGYTYLTRDEPG